MIQIIIAGIVAFVVAIMLTPVLIKRFSREGFGQEIRVEGPQSHQEKRGTPTMGGIAILIGLWAGYIVTHVTGIFTDAGGPTASGLLVLMLTTSLGIVGFLDDYIKIRKSRNLGLNKTSKLVGQFAAAILFAILVMRFRNDAGLTPASMKLSITRDIDIVNMAAWGGVLFVLFAYLVITSWSNAVNLTDGLDGLAAGSVAMVLGTYVIITYWQYRNSCGITTNNACYEVRDPLDLAIVCAAAMGACVGFLWWNAAPAQIFMGDTGSLALGGLVAGLSIVSRTELLMVVLGALFVVEAASVVIQVAVFRTTGRRPFRMAPFHHHFELGGWKETTVIIRFWLLVAISSALGLALFYSEWLSRGGAG